MYIQNIQTKIQPIELEWGSKYKHIPLNIKEDTQYIDNKTITIYIYDCVEKVPVPVTVDGIVNTALKSKFTQEFISYALANIFKNDDHKVKEYIDFAKLINEQAIAAGY